MVGITLYFSLWVSTYLVSIIVFSGSPNWPSTLSGLLIVATVVLAWTGSRVGALAAALAGSVVIVAFGFEGTPFVGPRVVAVLGLGALAVLGRRDVRPSWRWLWLPGSVIATALLAESVGTLFLMSYALSRFTLTTFAVIGLGALVWMAIDARLMVVVLTFLAAIGLQVTVGGVPVAFSVGFILIMTAIATPAIWLLRWQSARSVGVA